ncbi:hypothetical protein PsorP6_003298 [Peronosclerospora sorghi]|uniref:Uncharacterized protein n=1 Tax=Peronosclerospora sorghi TaxID=230839 RepID=A0ACC0VMU8_9STRA|nr:hypothetical protein PsorP6_003298 [Peronosclerospora sorghi]
MKGVELQRHLRAEARKPLTSKVFERLLAKFGDVYPKLKAHMIRGKHVQEYKNSEGSDAWVDIGYYLAVLEYAEGSTVVAAGLINRAMDNPNLDTEVAKRMERGQFFLWA